MFLKQRVPTTKYFSTLAFTKVISLSPGTTFSLPITFRPIERQEYADYVELTQVEFQKTFRIILSAVLPHPRLQVQSSLNMGMVCVNETVSSRLELRNTCELDVAFKWDVSGPFAVAPVTGRLAAHSATSVEFTFRPSAALIYTSSAVVRYAAAVNSSSTASSSSPPSLLDNYKQVDLRGQAKYPHILVETTAAVSGVGGENDVSTADLVPSNSSKKSATLSTTLTTNRTTTMTTVTTATAASDTLTLDFNKAYMSQSITRYITLVNTTEVRTEYLIEPSDNVPPFNRAFKCLQHMGVLQPFEKHKIPVCTLTTSK